MEERGVGEEEEELKDSWLEETQPIKSIAVVIKNGNKKNSTEI